MVYTIKPLDPTVSIKGFGSTLAPSFKQLSTFDYDPVRAWKQVSGSPSVRGTVSGGPSYERFLDFGSEQKFLPIAPRPALTASALLSSTAETYRRRLGVIEWDSIDPYSTLNQGADQYGMVAGEDNNPLAFLRGAQDFLASKDIDIFGMGATGAPARAADYALAFPLAIFAKISGQTSVGKTAKPGDDNPYYKLQADPRYWQTLIAAQPEQLDQLAREYAGRFVDPAVNGYVVEQLRGQFLKDRDVALGLSSGNEATDYRAIKYANRGLLTTWGGLQQIPAVGTQIVQILEPITPEERDAWQAMAPEARTELLGRFGTVQMGTDLIGSLPAFGALSTVLQVARSGGTVARGVASTYDWLLRGSGWLASAGLASAGANWAASSVWKEYSEFLGREVDAARPISGSLLAGSVNAIGYFASGTYGAWGLAKVGARVGGVTVGRTAGLAIRGIGNPEAGLYRDGLGGSLYAEKALAAGLDPKGLELSVKRTAMSYISHIVTDPLVASADAIASGAKIPGRPDLDALSIDERILAIGDELRMIQERRPAMAEQAIRLLTNARKPAALFQSEQARALYAWTKAQARTIDDAVSKRYLTDYGPDWVTREAGAYTEAAIRTYTEAAIRRVGGDPAGLSGIKGADGWAKMMRFVNAYEFDRNNGELAAVLAEAPGVPPTREAGRLSLVSSRHLFNDRAEEALAVLNGSDLAASRKMVDDIIDNTIEGERWFSSTYKPVFGKPRDRSKVNPAKMAQWLEDVQAALLVRRQTVKPDIDTATLPLNAFHTKLVDDGVWDLAFKPVNEAGEFVSYVSTRDGKAFQTPWLDYPLSNVDNIEIGNRGLLLSKYDGVTRAFRTWRIAEFQRGLLFRRLTGPEIGLDATASQINAFHEGILAASRELSVQPQTLGTAPESFVGVGIVFREKVEKAAIDAFGTGPYPTRAGGKVVIDWRDVVAKSYRQSLRLNLTAGLTSRMKANFGAVGHAAAYGSDIGYVNLRFNMSPVFKLGEVEESLQLNAMAGVDPRGDPWVESLFSRSGIGESHDALTQELNYDQMLLGMKPGNAQARQATAYGFNAIRAPETLAQKTARSALQARGEAFREFVKGGNSVFASPRHALEVELAGLVDDAGNILPGMDDRADEISRLLTGELRYDEIRAARQVGPELPSAEWSTDPLGLGGRGAPDWIDETLRPEDRGLWHATTNVDGVMADGLMSRVERIKRGDETVGLGALFPDRDVSLTTSYDHAALIETRMRLAAAAARDQATGKEIIDHFWDAYETTYGPDEAMNRMADQVLATSSQVDWLPPKGMARSAGEGYNADFIEATIDNAFTGKGKYEVVQKLDAELMRHPGEAEGVLSVGLAGEWKDMLRVKPENIGIVQVGFKKGSTWKEGPDVNEVQMASKTIWTLDQRILDAPLATDREGLLVQLRQTLRDDGETVVPGFQAYHDRVVESLAALDAETAVPAVDRIEDIPGTPEFLTNMIEDQAPDLLKLGVLDQPGMIRRAYEAVKNPIPGKQRQALLYRIEKLRREFPTLIRAAGLTGFEDVMKQLGIPERNWSVFLLRDRELAGAFSASGHPDDLAALLAHSGDDARGTFDQLYASEEWSALTSLWAIADRTAADDAFRVHFFNPYRTALERSLNHPLLGVYPLSWAYKAAREWMRFLYANKTIPGLRLGMTPAVALNHISRAQNATFAQTNDETLDEYIGLQGPFGSAFLIFNLILPGDWSSIPFPASRTIRDLVRGNFGARTLGDNISSLGAARDARLLLETAGELKDFAFGPDQTGKNAPPPLWEPFISPESIRSQPFLRK